MAQKRIPLLVKLITSSQVHSVKFGSGAVRMLADKGFYLQNAGTITLVRNAATVTGLKPAVKATEKVSADKVKPEETEKPSEKDAKIKADRERLLASCPSQDHSEPMWTEKQLSDVIINHDPPLNRVDRAAYYTVQTLRSAFDLFSGYSFGRMTEAKWIRRIIFLETVAGVPGMVGGMIRHLNSLRRMKRDHGWIHTLLDEAQNERMHLIVALQIRQPGPLFRGTVILAQGVFVGAFSLAYLISPRFCHRFVGYLEEEAVKTYTKCLEHIKEGSIMHWQNTVASDVAINYWRMKPGSTIHDMIRNMRADEANHREVNHTLGLLGQYEAVPFPAPK